MTIKVFIIDDHKILVDSFIDYFKHIHDIEIIGFALSGCEAIEVLNRKENNREPDVVLQDVGLTDMNGLECAEVLLKNNPHLKIIGFSSYMEPSIVRKMMRKDAKGYISKATDIAQLEDAIRKVQAGEKFLGKQIAKILADANDGIKKKRVLVLYPNLPIASMKYWNKLHKKKIPKKLPTSYSSVPIQ